MGFQEIRKYVGFGKNILMWSLLFYGVKNVLFACGTIKKNEMAPPLLLTDNRHQESGLWVIDRKNRIEAPYTKSGYGTSRDFVLPGRLLPKQPPNIPQGKVAVHFHKEHNYNEQLHGKVYTTDIGIEYILVDVLWFK